MAGSEEKGTTLALFFSLKPSLLMMKTSPNVETEPDAEPDAEPGPNAARLRLRRRSSMTDLDKIRNLPKSQRAPDRKLGVLGLFLEFFTLQKSHIVGYKKSNGAHSM